MPEPTEAEWLEGNYPDARRDQEIANIAYIIESHNVSDEGTYGAAEEIWLYINGNPDCQTENDPPF